MGQRQRVKESQSRCRRRVGEEAARRDAADAGAPRQADVPEPARFVRGRDGLRRDRTARRHRHLRRERAVVEKHVATVDPLDPQMASDQESGMAGAVDEQPGGDVAMFARADRSEEHTSELQSLMRISYAVFCLKTKTTINHSKY